MTQYDRQPATSDYMRDLPGSDPDISLIADAEQLRLLDRWNATEQEYPHERCMHELFEAQAVRTPDAIALIWESERLSYRELNERANQLAWYLRRHGVGGQPAAEVLVGICADRSPAMIVGLLGILKAGGAYVPLDPAYPRERQLFMLEDSRCPVLITARSPRATSHEPPAALGAAFQGRVVDLNADWPVIAQESTTTPASGARPANLAYVIYTSGSTGRPKGVAIMHQSAVAFISWAVTVFAPEQLRGVLAGTSICFDLSVFEIFATLSGGGTIILAENALELPLIPAATAVTLINTVPSAIAELLRLNAIPAAAQTINLAGEPLPLRLVQQLYQQPTIQHVINLYGPSEDTTYSTYAVIPSQDERAPSIGRPIANTRVYLLDELLRPVPIGQVGELYLGGAGLARGYLNRPTLTAEKFIPDPFAGAGGGARLYRTGDLARYRPDGQIEFLGRRDHQVKLRGFRIELGEIEAALYQHPAVQTCVTVMREDVSLTDGHPDRRLVAYVVEGTGDQGSEIREADTAAGTRPPLTPGDLRIFLKQRLPEYMVPSAFVLLPTLPLTPNGKIDRQALPAPVHSRPALSHGYQPPRTALEAELAAIWSEVLEVEPVGVHDHVIDLGGHSLHVTRILSRIYETLQVNLPIPALFQRPTIAELAPLIESGQSAETALAQPPLVPVPRGEPLPASFAQQRLWFLEQWEPGLPAYNMPIAIRMAGPLDTAVLQRSLDAILARHEPLRTVFTAVDGQPMTVITDQRAIELLTIDLSDRPAEEREAAAQGLASQLSQHRFDLTSGPLICSVLLRLDQADHLLVLIMHHIVSDDWSMGVLFRELGTLYAADRAGRAVALPPLAIQYADFAIWQRAWFQGQVLEQQLQYWRQQLAGAPGALELPADRPRPPAQSLQGALHSFMLPAPLVGALEELGRQESSTLFMVLLAAFQTLLHRYTAQDDLVVGSPIANRTRVEIEPLIGFFINTLVLRTDLSGNPTFRALLGRVRQVCLDAYVHQDLPFERLVEALQPTRDPSRAPLVQVMLVLQNAPMQPLDLDGLALTPVPIDNGTAKLDLALYLEEQAGGLRGTVEYSTDLFERPRIARLVEHFRMLLEGIVADADQPIAALPLLSAAERQLLQSWNDTAQPYPRQVSVHELFAQRAAQQPHALAIVSDQAELTYQELDQQASRLARLLQSLGVGDHAQAEMPVAICLDRSIDLVVALLATLKAGGFYVPLAPTMPPERLALMLQDIGAPVLITVASLWASEGQRVPDSFAPPTVLYLDQDWSAQATELPMPTRQTAQPEQLAYLIYTSGSTGVPKGVAVSHASLLNLVAWHQRVYEISAADRATLLAGVAFDASVWELWPYLLAGASVHIPDESLQADVPALVEWIAARAITVCFMPTPLAEIAIEAGWPSHTALRWLLTGGDRLHRSSLRQLPCALVNNYGPTENTVVTTSGIVAPADDTAALPPPIGRPIDNVQVYLLDAQMAPVPVGVPGELYIGGDSLARGYWRQPGLTAERFVPDPFAQRAPEAVGGRLYRSGDLARYRPDGQIEYLGRSDQQRKLRGFRIELGEIEAVLRQHSGVDEAVVLLREDRPGDQQLVAYVVAAVSGQPSAVSEDEPGREPSTDHRSPLTSGELRDFLKPKLPEYMIPGALVLLDALPRTANGKIDRAGLAAPGQIGSLAEQTFVAPRTPVETVLAGMWGEALQVEQVSIHDNFFDLGGHSLNATKIVSRIRQAFQTDLRVRHLFAAPTVAELAEHMVTIETQPGRTAKIARALQQLKHMSDQDRQQMLQQKKSTKSI